MVLLRIFFDSLQAIGDKITEDSLVLQILNGLHIDYQMFVTAIENTDVKPTSRNSEPNF